MAKIEFEVTDNKCIKLTPVLNSPAFTFECLYKEETIITKEAFIECYNKWIKGDAEKGNCDRNICVQNEYNGISCDECICGSTERG